MSPLYGNNSVQECVIYYMVFSTKCNTGFRISIVWSLFYILDVPLLRGFGHQFLQSKLGICLFLEIQDGRLD